MAFFTFLPAVLMGFIAPLPTLNEFLFDFFAVENDFWHIFINVTGLTVPSAALWPVSLIVAALTLSYTSAIIERDMHVGDFHYVQFGRSINNNFFAYLCFIFFSVVGAEFMLFVAALFINLWVVVSNGLTGLAFVLTCVSLLLAVLLLAAIFSMIIIWPAFMIYTGTKPFSALGNILRLKRSKWEIAAAVILPVLVYEVIIIVFTLFKITALEKIVNIIFLTFVGVYCPVLINTVYYDVSGQEREDLKKLSLWNRRNNVM
ncbi:MAG: hypothetical protein LBT30_05475 [Clostridiales bacterium]|nr:hypothetical protein [Clostridiales bacterium]